MMRLLRTALLMLALLTFLTGVVYPLFVTAIAQVLFPAQANGSLLGEPERPLGSTLIGQANDDPRYFQPRPSATGYGTLPSGGSNLGPTSKTLAEQVARRAEDFRVANDLSDDLPVPVDMLFASASGLDPHISPAAARLQVPRVADARGLDETRVAMLVEEFVEGPQFGILGEPRVNVLLLNIALDRLQ
jgi:K+-transporting ATPase ATPase C chain